MTTTTVHEYKYAPLRMDDLRLLVHRLSHGCAKPEEEHDEDNECCAFPDRRRGRIESRVCVQTGMQLIDVAGGRGTLLRRGTKSGLVRLHI